MNVKETINGRVKTKYGYAQVLEFNERIKKYKIILEATLCTSFVTSNELEHGDSLYRAEKASV